MAVTLRLCWGGVSIFYAQITTILPEGLAIKLEPIIRDESVWDPKSRYDIPPYKSLHILISDVSKRLGLHPLSEVIHCDEEEILTSGGLREQANDV